MIYGNIFDGGEVALDLWPINRHKSINCNIGLILGYTFNIRELIDSIEHNVIKLTTFSDIESQVFLVHIDYGSVIYIWLSCLWVNLAFSLYEVFLDIAFGLAF